MPGPISMTAVRLCWFPKTSPGNFGDLPRPRLANGSTRWAIGSTGARWSASSRTCTTMASKNNRLDRCTGRLRSENFNGAPLSVQRNVAFAVRSPGAGTEAFVEAGPASRCGDKPNCARSRRRTLQEIYGRSMAQTSFALVMLAIAGGMALVLGVIGVYGVIAHTVEQRRREVGIRMALGAPAAAVTTDVSAARIVAGMRGHNLRTGCRGGFLTPDVFAAIWRDSVRPRHLWHYCGGIAGRGDGCHVHSGAPRRLGGSHGYASRRVAHRLLCALCQ